MTNVQVEAPTPDHTGSYERRMPATRLLGGVCTAVEVW